MHQVIPLNKGRYAVVDPELWEYVMQWNWTAKLQDNYYYAYRHRLLHETTPKEMIYLHHVVADYYKMEVPPKHVIDHISRDALDNRLANLRVVTYAQNALNATKRNSKSGFMGVRWDKNQGLWRAYYTKDGKEKFVCYAGDRETAAMYRDKAVIKEYSNAALNFPELAIEAGKQAARLEPYQPTNEELEFLSTYVRVKHKPRQYNEN